MMMMMMMIDDVAKDCNCGHLIFYVFSCTLLCKKKLRNKYTTEIFQSAIKVLQLNTMPLPSIEETKLGAILNGLPDEVEEVKNSVLRISNKYRSDLTNQLNQSYEFETLLIKNFNKLDKSLKKSIESTEDLNSSLNKKLDYLKDYSSMAELTSTVSDTIGELVGSLQRIEMLLPYSTRLGVVDSPHRTHYPLLYKLMNPEWKKMEHDEAKEQEQEQETTTTLDGYEEIDENEIRQQEQGQDASDISDAFIKKSSANPITLVVGTSKAVEPVVAAVEPAKGAQSSETSDTPVGSSESRLERELRKFVV